jgi:probable HAF family extracellular repeat protein
VRFRVFRTIAVATTLLALTASCPVALAQTTTSATSPAAGLPAGRLAGSKSAVTAGSVGRTWRPHRAGYETAAGHLGKVTGAGITAATTTSLTLQWTNPPGHGFSGVVIRRAKGGKAPRFTTGTLVAATGRRVFKFTDRHLRPGTQYSFALFALGSGRAHAAADTVTGTTDRPLAISTTVLPPGTAGMTYHAALAASGGTLPYRWKARGLPAGLSLAASGVISGYPATTGSRKITVTVDDAQRASRSAVLTLKVPVALPRACAAKSCAELSRDGRTVPIPAADITGVTRDASTKAVTQVTLTGATVTTGDVLVLAPAPAVPSGLIAVAVAVTRNSDGTATVAVTPATPADAFDRGTVQVLPHSTSSGTAAVAYVRGTDRHRGAAGAPRSDGPTLSCSGNVSSDLHGMSISHTLTPALAAIWKHPFFGGGGVYVGSGGLSLFQFDLDGTISLNMGIAVSGASKCTLTLPKLQAVVPAGDLGAVIFSTTPSLTFSVTGAIDVRSTVTLSCGAEYRWDNGASSRLAYCVPLTTTPLRLTAATGLDATLKGNLAASITLDDITGINGDVWAQLHAGYHPATHPVAELDAAAGYDLSACLACFWSGSPAKVTIGSGTFFSRVIATYGDPPTPAPSGYSTADYPGATQTSAVGVNDSRQIVGDYVSKAGVTNGYSEIDGKFTTIDDPSADPSSNYLGAAYGINDAGTIVGSYINSSGHYEGFMDNAGAFTNISYPGAEATLAEDINDAGTVVGWFYDTNGGPHGFILSSGTYTEVNHPGAGTSSGQGTGLNGIADNGTITGWYMTSHNVEHGFLYKSGSFTSVNMPGAADSAATCISRSGALIVGVFWNAGSQISGFELDRGVYTPLRDPAAGKGSTEPQDVNNTGTVVGIYTPPGRATSAFIFTPPTSPP